MKHDVHAVLDEDRLELFALQIGRTVRLARRVRRMMEEADLPVGTARRQLLVEPVQLFVVDVVAVEREEPHARFSGLNE